MIKQQRKTETIDDITISYIQAGSGERTILCIHGFGASSAYFSPLFDELANTYTVIAPDQPDFGQSGDTSASFSLEQLANIHQRLVECLHLSQLTVVAHSFGTQIAAELAVMEPHLLSHLVLICPTVNSHENTFEQQLTRYLEAASNEKFDEIKIALKDFRRAGLRRLIQTLPTALGDEIKDKLPQINTPTLVLYGDEDPLCPTYWTEEVASLLPNGQSHLIKGGDHTFHFNKPKEVSEAITRFIKTSL